MAKYQLIGHIVEYHMIAQESFDHIFAKYAVAGNPKTDIYLDSFYVDEITFENNDPVVSGEGYVTLKDKNGILTYAIKEKDIFIGKVLCDDEKGIYHVYVNRAAPCYYVEYIMLQCALSRYFNHHLTSIFIHASAIMYEGKAIMFSAPSGTGKSTQSRLWHEYYGATYINDDKNLIIYEDGQLMVYGTPISGKHQLDNNVKAPLIGLVFIKQAKENKLRKLSKMEAFLRLMNQIQRPEDEKMMDRITPIMDSIIDFPCYELECTISKEAVNLVRKAYFSGDKK